MADTTYLPKVYKKDGGDTLIIASGGALTGESGATIDTGAGATFKIGGVTLASSAAQIDQAANGAVNSEIVVATNVILAAESGATFFLNAATEFVSTLPAPALGLRFTFIVTGAPSGASYTVVAASGTPIHGMVLSKDLNGATDSGATAGTGVLTLTFVDGKSQKGDRADFISDGTDWFVRATTGGNFDAITLS